MNSALGLKICRMANTRSRNTCACPPYSSKSASPATLSTQIPIRSNILPDASAG
jgi:hypothetical protein